jgi:hypothetical protein
VNNLERVLFKCLMTNDRTVDLKNSKYGDTRKFESNARNGNEERSLPSADRWCDSLW